MLQGGCHCGRVRYQITGPVRQVVECHCESCRRITGSVWHATATRRADLTVTDDEGVLRWYNTSPRVKRGFCGHCGSTLFFQPDGAESTVITAGSLDQPTGLHLMMRIFTDEAADYAADCSLDGIPHHPGMPEMHHFDIPEK